MEEVGIRQLKAQLSAYLRHVKRGQTVVITERGRPIGQILPMNMSLDARMEALRRAGLITGSGKKLRSLEPVAKIRGEKTVAELLLEDRD